MKNTKRVFLALVLPPDIKQQLDVWRKQHLSGLDAKPIAQQNYHITLVYIGNVSEPELAALLDEIKPVKAEPFSLMINKTDYWPKPKVLHLSPTLIPPPLSQLQRQLELVLKQAGAAIQIRPYRPHVSIYRKIKPDQFEQLVNSDLPEPKIRVAIDRFALYESVLTPAGVRYDRLETFGLTPSLA